MRLIKNTAKVIGAGITAVIILSLVLCGYSITPVHVDNKKGNTDYVWPSRAFWVRMTEGISWGRFDQNGYNNKKVIEHPDVIVLGSSHMEATYVKQNENVAAVLNELFNGSHSVYNLGVSDHNFYKACHYVPNNLELYSPRYLVIETSGVNISPKRTEEAVNHKIFKTPSFSTGVVGTMQKIPFIRLVYQQSQSGLIDLFVPGFSKDEKLVDIEVPYEYIDDEPYDMLLGYLSELEQQYDAEIIIFYHPPETLHEDGSVSFYEADYLRKFTEKSEEYGISFVDMTDTFRDMYYNEHHLPHGFVTGKIGEGHLNRYGHRAVAQEVYKAINKLEEEQKNAND